MSCRVIPVDGASRLKSGDLRALACGVVGIGFVGGATDIAIVVILISSSRGARVSDWEVIRILWVIVGVDDHTPRASWISNAFDTKSLSSSIAAFSAVDACWTCSLDDLLSNEDGRLPCFGDLALDFKVLLLL